MDRVPEPELMEGEMQAEAYANADFTEPHSNFVRLFQECWPAQTISGTVLDLGCGTADISLRFAQAYPGCEIVGVDASDTMLRWGRKLLATHGLRKRVSLLQCHLPATTLATRRYDVVISNSLLHHLKDPLVLWETIKQCAQPDAKLFIMDLLRPEDEHQAHALVSQYAAAEADILQHDFYQSLLAAYRVDEVRSQLDQAGLEHMHIEVVSDRHFTVSGTMHGPANNSINA